MKAAYDDDDDVLKYTIENEQQQHSAQNKAKIISQKNWKNGKEKKRRKTNTSNIKFNFSCSDSGFSFTRI